ncbi:hypothetical protein [Sandarakinorhabdus sp.]|uniref:hypothetical protein n=1 Tax=Sandarakinorhabdus sp. TaxID=1916663 RepID=UPI003F713812
MARSALAAVMFLLAAPAMAAEPATEPETRNCLQLGNLRQTIVRNDSTIDFVLRDGSVWRNNLPFRCAQLGIERAFSYQTSISQLCRQDLISVVLQTGGQPLGARCGLGEFQRQPTPPPKPK